LRRAVTTTLSLTSSPAPGPKGTTSPAHDDQPLTLNENDIGDYNAFANSIRRCGARRKGWRWSRPWPASDRHGLLRPRPQEKAQGPAVFTRRLRRRGLETLLAADCGSSMPI